MVLDREGQVKQAAGQLEIKDRQYSIEFASVPVVINGFSHVANEVKVISNLKVKNGTGQHQGTIDVDIDTLPGGHITLQYSGTATLTGSTITSKGVFKSVKTTGIFAGLVAEGNYEMTTMESGATLGAPATVSITTTSAI